MAAALVVAVCFTVAGLAAQSVRRSDVRRDDDRFATAIANRSERLEERLANYESALLAERAALELAPTMDVTAFRHPQAHARLPS